MTAYAFGKGFGGAFGKGMKDSPFAPDNQFDDGVTIEEVAQAKGLNFQFEEVNSLYLHKGCLHSSPQKTIIRNDTGEFISTMSAGYKVVQPMEILETHRQFLDVGGYHLRAAGIFKNGARFWSMAEGHGELELAGGDKVKSYLFMASACDGSSATYAIGTNQRMSCWNMAPGIILDAKNNGKFIRVTHSQVFNADDARVQIQANDDNFKLWCEDARHLAQEKIQIEQAQQYFNTVFDIEEENEIDDQGRLNKRVQKCLELFSGAGMGSQLEAAKSTAWGMYNAVTEFVDHHAKNNNAENRFMNATMGNGLRLKRRAWENALEMIG